MANHGDLPGLLAQQWREGPRFIEAIDSKFALLSLVASRGLFRQLIWVFSDDTTDRREVFLFKASTIITLVSGVGMAFGGLLALNFVAAAAGASVVGGLGAGSESDESVREAAYSHREAQRRKQWHDRRASGSKASSGQDTET